MLVQSGVRGGSPAGKKIAAFPSETAVFTGFFEAHFSQSQCGPKVACSLLLRRPSAIHAACCFLCSCLSSTWSLPDTAGAIGMYDVICSLWQRQQSNDVHFCGLRRRMLLLLKRTIRFCVSGAACAFACCAAACCCPPRSGGLR